MNESPTSPPPRTDPLVNIALSHCNIYVTLPEETRTSPTANPPTLSVTDALRFVRNATTLQAFEAHGRSRDPTPRPHSPPYDQASHEAPSIASRTGSPSDVHAAPPSRGDTFLEIVQQALGAHVRPRAPTQTPAPAPASAPSSSPASSTMHASHISSPSSTHRSASMQPLFNNDIRNADGPRMIARTFTLTPEDGAASRVSAYSHIIRQLMSNTDVAVEIEVGGGGEEATSVDRGVSLQELHRFTNVGTYAEFVLHDIEIDNDNDNDTEDECDACGICREAFAPHSIVRQISRCGHVFHTHCIEEWLHAHARCPNCMQNVIVEDASPPSSPASSSAGVAAAATDRVFGDGH